MVSQLCSVEIHQQKKIINLHLKMNVFRIYLVNTLRNKAQLIGRLDQDSEIVSLKYDHKMAKFSMV